MSMKEDMLFSMECMHYLSVGVAEEVTQLQ